MSRKETNESESNEFELVLGNKQLLSVFFIVVILLGVFFTMGYVVGRNSAPVDAARRVEQNYDRQNAPSAVPASTSAQREAPTAESIGVNDPPVQAKPAKPESNTPRSVQVAPLTVTQPEVGQTYLQVLAVAKSEAEVLAEVLAKKGFHALVAPGPNDKVFRVLVGPANDASHVIKLRADLEAAGFKPFVKRY